MGFDSRQEVGLGVGVVEREEVVQSEPQLHVTTENLLPPGRRGLHVIAVYVIEAHDPIKWVGTDDSERRLVEPERGCFAEPAEFSANSWAN